MHLDKLYRKFDAQCKKLETRAKNIQTTKSTISNWEFSYLTNSLISVTWINWCSFCRELLIASCQGSIARNNQKILKRNLLNSPQRISYEASLVKANSTTLQMPTANGHLNFPMWKEPTWGDPQKITRLITALNPSNSSTLLSIFGSANSLQHLQITRNACAHKNSETINSIRSLSLDYSFSKINHPTELAWTIHKPSNEIAIFYWLYEMNLIADYATSTN